VLLALCLRLLVPLGWMPVASPTGVLFTLCSGSGEQRTVFVPTKARDHAPESAQDHAAPCAFSGISAPCWPSLPPVLPLRLLAPRAAPGLFALQTRPIAVTPRLRPPLRGPPHAA
jgi:hypothetical protein